MQFYKNKILSPGQLKRLSEHKYSCSSASLLDKYLQPWWEWLVSYVPLWLAPNLITVVGLIINIATTLILVYYSPDAKSEVIYLMHNIIIFIIIIFYFLLFTFFRYQDGHVFYVHLDYLYIKV